MPPAPSQWSKAEELKRLLMEEPTAAEEYLRSSLSGTVEALRRAAPALHALAHGLLELRDRLPLEDDRTEH